MPLPIHLLTSLPLNPVDLRGPRLRPTREALLVSVDAIVMGASITASVKIKWTELILTVGAVLVGALVIQFRGVIASTTLVSTWAPANPTVTVPVITVAAVAGGMGLAIWKRSQLLTYGLYEIAFGTVAIVQVVPTLWPTGEIAKFVALGSALYVISRGVGNCIDAMKHELLADRVALEFAGQNVLSVKGSQQGSVE